MCNNSGSVYCESCDDVMIEGITWDRCGDPNGTDIAGVTFNGTSNISLVNCTFQLSQISSVTFLNVSRNIHVNHCNFLSNRRTQLPIHNKCGGLSIHYSGSNFVWLTVLIVIFMIMAFIVTIILVMFCINWVVFLMFWIPMA